jgi:hypothetical protein
LTEPPKSSGKGLEFYKKQAAFLQQKNTPKPDNITLNDYANTLKTSYQNSQKLLDQGAQKAAEEASVALDIAQRYLPVLNRMNGMSGLGVSESGAIEAYNNYMNQIGGIKQTHASDSAKLFSDYQSALREEEEKKQQALDAKQSETYQELMTIINSGAFNSADELSTLVDQAKGKVNEDQWSTLDYLRNYYKNSPEQKAIEKERGAAEVAAEEAEKQEQDLKDSFRTNDAITLKSNIGRTSMVNGDNFELKLGDQVYDVESRGVVTDESIDNIASSVGDGKVFAYNGKIYFKKNDNVYQIGGRGGNDNSKDYGALYNAFYGVSKEVLEEQNRSNKRARKMASQLYDLPEDYNDLELTAAFLKNIARSK